MLVRKQNSIEFEDGVAAFAVGNQVHNQSQLHPRSTAPKQKNAAAYHVSHHFGKQDGRCR